MGFAWFRSSRGQKVGAVEVRAKDDYEADILLLCLSQNHQNNHHHTHRFIFIIFFIAKFKVKYRVYINIYIDMLKPNIQIF